MQKTGIRYGGTQIVLEMSNIRVAFEENDGEFTRDGKPKGYKFVSTLIPTRIDVPIIGTLLRFSLRNVKARRKVLFVPYYGAVATT
jgi:hypothetical protein